MVHQPSGGYQGQVTDIMIHARESEALKRRLNEIYVKHTGRDIAAVEQALERDNFMTAEAAQEFGIIDQVLAKRPEPRHTAALICKSWGQYTPAVRLFGVLPVAIDRACLCVFA